MKRILKSAAALALASLMALSASAAAPAWFDYADYVAKKAAAVAEVLDVPAALEEAAAEDVVLSKAQTALEAMAKYDAITDFEITKVEGINVKLPTVDAPVVAEGVDAAAAADTAADAIDLTALAGAAGVDLTTVDLTAAAAAAGDLLAGATDATAAAAAALLAGTTDATDATAAAVAAAVDYSKATFEVAEGTTGTVEFALAKDNETRKFLIVIGEVEGTLAVTATGATVKVVNDPNADVSFVYLTYSKAPTAVALNIAGGVSVADIAAGAYNVTDSAIMYNYVYTGSVRYTPYPQGGEG